MLPFNFYPYTDFHEMNLSWIIEIVKKMGVEVEGLEELVNKYTGDIQAQIDVIQKWIDDYDDSFVKTEIEKYIATMIFVEISDAGFIVYYIPDTWDEITFNTTDLDILIPDVDYGHLVLSY